MTRHFLFAALPFQKSEVTRALEAGINGIITDPTHLEKAASLSRFSVFCENDIHFLQLTRKSDEEYAISLLASGKQVILRRGWEIIPVENILAQNGNLGLEIGNLDEAKLALEILEKGVCTLVILPQAITQIREIITLCQTPKTLNLKSATILEIRQVASGNRVCVDTLSLLHAGEGLLVGNTGSCSFLVQGEMEHNAYVAPRPFRINAGSVQSYVHLPNDKTAYLEELQAGKEILLVSADGSTRSGVVGRTKTEIRPMVLIKAQCEGIEGQIFLQNAETVRLVRPDGKSISIVDIAPDDTVLCHLNNPGRHFGTAVNETIRER